MFLAALPPAAARMSPCCVRVEMREIREGKEPRPGDAAGETKKRGWEKPAG